MRKCLRCGCEMKDNLKFPAAQGNAIRTKGLGAKAVYPKLAICLRCGEVSLYIDEEKLEKLKE